MLDALLELLKDFFYWVGNTFIEILAQLIDVVSLLLPEYQLPDVVVDFGGYPIVQSLNWVFPVGTAITMVNAYVFSVGLYFTLGVVTRWAKVTN